MKSFLVIAFILYCRYNMMAHGDCFLPPENLTTSSAYGMNTASANQQETYVYATVGNAESLTTSSPKASNSAYSTTSQS